MNKAGALLLVVGIALFLAYSVGHMTAAGRAAMALIVRIVGVAGRRRRDDRPQPALPVARHYRGRLLRRVRGYRPDALDAIRPCEGSDCDSEFSAFRV